MPAVPVVKKDITEELLQQKPMQSSSAPVVQKIKMEVGDLEVDTENRESTKEFLTQLSLNLLEVPGELSEDIIARYSKDEAINPLLEKIAWTGPAKALVGLVPKNRITTVTSALSELAISQSDVEFFIDKILRSRMPSFYLPTTPDMWKIFIRKILYYRDHPLTVSDETNHPFVRENEEANLVRSQILSDVHEKNLKASDPKTIKQADEDIERKLAILRGKLMNADLTVNLPIDKMFNFHTPYFINSFEAAAKGKKTENTGTDELLKDRQEAETDLFGLDKAVAPRLRPRYCALNINNNTFGAAPRNDYGLCHYKLADHVKKSATFTLGDTFEAKPMGAFLLDKAGIDGAINTLRINWKNGIGSEVEPVVEGGPYNSGHLYFDTQIHADIDIRRDVKEIVVSTAEMILFGVNIRQVDALIKNITSGVFIRVE